MSNITNLKGALCAKARPNLTKGASFGILELAFNFVPGGNNSEEALTGLLFTYSLGTALGLLLAFFPLIKYPLDKTAHDEIRRQLDALPSTA